MQYMNETIESTSTYACYARKEDMIHCVNSIIVAVGRMNTLSVFDNVFIQEYLKCLDPKHKLPHRFERICLVEVLIDGAIMEFGRITKVMMKWHLYLFIPCKSNKHSYPSACHFFQERYDLLGPGFLGGNIDFWTDSHRK